MKNGMLWIGAIVIIALAAFFIFNPFNAGGTGTIKLYLTDAPADVNVSSVVVTLSDIQVHYAGTNNPNATTNETETGEWRTLVQGPITYNLIDVKDAAAFLGSDNVPAGKYTQIRLNVDSAKATIDGKERPLAIGSNTIKIVRPFDVIADQEIKLTLDFNAQDSIIEQGNGQYRMQPTIKLLIGNEPKT